MTKWIRVQMTLAAAAALFAACGGSTGQTAEFVAAAPTYSALALAQSEADLVAPSSAPAAQPSPALTVDASTGASLTTTTDCHPHLFARSHAIMARLNRHFWKHLRHVRDLIEDHPALADGQEHVWETLKDGLDRKLVMQRTTNADGSHTFTFVLSMKSGAMTDFVNTMSGSVTLPAHAAADAGAVATTRSGTVTYDFTALAQAIPTEKARGQVIDTWTFQHDPSKPGAGEKNQKHIQLVNFEPELVAGETPSPKNADYQYEREPGIGGKLTFQDQIVFACDNPNALAADVTDVARWYHSSDGTVHGRADAKAVNGPIPAGNKWVGYTCGITGTSTTPAEGEWLLKEEDATGASTTFYYAQAGASPCDPLFGVVPDKTDAAHDFDFSSAVTFPNEW